MKRYETVTETVTSQKIVSLTCDLCGKDGKYNWGGSAWDVNETEISIRCRTGKDYPSGGWGEHYEVHICPDCFKNKLVPWLNQNGANIQSEEWDT